MKIRKILIIRIRRVGDAILGTSICSTLKKTFPDAEIHYLLSSPIACLYEHHPDVDKVIKLDRNIENNILRFFPYAYSVSKSNKYDVIIDTRGTFKTLLFSLFSRSTAYRIGPKKFYSFIGLNYKVDIRKTGSMIEQNFDLITPLSRIKDIQFDEKFTLHITPKESQSFLSYMSSMGIDKTKPIILAAVTTRLKHKALDRSKMVKLISHILNTFPEVQIIFNYAKDEKDDAISIHKELNLHPNIFTSIEAKNLRELCALTANSDFFFGNEGGARHLSQAFEIPSFAIFPPNISKEKWLPNPCERYTGISPTDACTDLSAKSMAYSDQFALLTTEVIWEKLKLSLEKFLNFKKN